MRIAILIIGLGTSLIVGLQSLAVSTGANLTENTRLSAAGGAGIVLAILCLIGAAFALQKPAISSVSFGVALLAGLFGGGLGFTDLYWWAFATGCLCALSLLEAREGADAPDKGARPRGPQSPLGGAVYAGAGIAAMIAAIALGKAVAHKNEATARVAAPAANSSEVIKAPSSSAVAAPADVAISDSGWGTDESFGDDTFIQWRASVTNGGDRPILSANVRITFFAENGLPLSSDTMSVKAIAAGETQSATETHIGEGREANARVELVDVEYAN